MLLDHAAGKKTGALAASIAAQSFAVGVLVLVPLIYNEQLPDVRPWLSLTLPLPPLAPEPPQPKQETQPTGASVVRSIFHAPIRIPTTPALADTPLIEQAAPSGVVGPGILGGIEPAPTAFLGLRIDAPPPVVRPAAPKPTSEPIRVASTIQAAKLMNKVVPLYPALAKQARISGTVHLLGVIAKDGTIQRLQVIGGHPLLTGAAIDAVRQWVYQPTLLNGEAVEVMAPIDVIFTLSQ